MLTRRFSYMIALGLTVGSGVGLHMSDSLTRSFTNYLSLSLSLSHTLSLSLSISPSPDFSHAGAGPANVVAVVPPIVLNTAGTWQAEVTYTASQYSSHDAANETVIVNCPACLPVVIPEHYTLSVIMRMSWGVYPVFKVLAQRMYSPPGMSCLRVPASKACHVSRMVFQNALVILPHEGNP